METVYTSDCRMCMNCHRKFGKGKLFCSKSGKRLPSSGLMKYPEKTIPMRRHPIK